MGLLDNTIRFFSPETALKREAAKLALNELEKRSNYDAAKGGRRLKNWKATDAGPTLTIGNSLEVLRNRSRDLSRNNPWAKKAVNVLKTNVVGTGIRANIESKNKRLADAWRMWADTKQCDFEGRKTLYAIEALAFKTMVESGECLIRMRVDTRQGEFPIKLQVLEPDFLDHGRDSMPTAEGEFTQFGIKFDKEGRRLGYWLFPRHPHENQAGGLMSNFVPADEVVHLYREERPGQARGVPFGVSAFIRMYDLDEYDSAQLIRQKIAACFSVFVTSTGESPITGNSASKVTEKVEPGLIQYLERGEQVVFGNPPGADGYPEYTRKVLQAIAAGYEVTYEAMTGDLSYVNFSSGRMGWLEFHRNVTDLQHNTIIPLFLDRVFEWFFMGAKLAGAVPMTLPQPFVTWTPPRREMIDPVKETKAIIAAIQGGIQPWSEAVREQGYDPAWVLEQLAADKESFDALGLVLSSDARYGLKLPGLGAQDGNTNDGGDGGQTTK